MKIQIVNENDELIGLKERSDIDYQKDIYRVSGLWLTNSKGQVLLAKRALTKDTDPGKWGPAVAGTVEEGETYESNIYKEAGEEIGLTGVNFEFGPKIRQTGPRNYFAQWYIANTDRDISSFVLQAEEVDEIAWVDIDLLKKEMKAYPDKFTPSLFRAVLELNF